MSYNLQVVPNNWMQEQKRHPIRSLSFDRFILIFPITRLDADLNLNSSCQSVTTCNKLLVTNNFLIILDTIEWIISTLLVRSKRLPGLSSFQLRNLLRMIKSSSAQLSSWFKLKLQAFNCHAGSYRLAQSVWESLWKSLRFGVGWPRRCDGNRSRTVQSPLIWLFTKCWKQRERKTLSELRKTAKEIKTFASGNLNSDLHLISGERRKRMKKANGEGEWRKRLQCLLYTSNAMTASIRASDSEADALDSWLTMNSLLSKASLHSMELHWKAFLTLERTRTNFWPLE